MGETKAAEKEGKSQRERKPERERERLIKVKRAERRIARRLSRRQRNWKTEQEQKRANMRIGIVRETEGSDSVRATMGLI